MRLKFTDVFFLLLFVHRSNSGAHIHPSLSAYVYVVDYSFISKLIQISAVQTHIFHRFFVANRKRREKKKAYFVQDQHAKMYLHSLEYLHTKNRYKFSFHSVQSRLILLCFSIFYFFRIWKFSKFCLQKKTHKNHSEQG